MRYVTLKPEYALRGWSDLPYALLNLQEHSTNKKVKRLTKSQAEAIELATAGGISIDEPLLPQRLRDLARRGLEEGFLEECGPEKKLEEYQKYRYSKARYTHTLLWSITGNCNLRCKHCYISSGENCYGELSFEKCLEAMDQMVEANVNMVALTGGEPLVRRDFWQIVDALLERHISILQVFTNGVMVTERWLEEFEKRPINPNYFLLSFDGVGCHDWLRGVPGAEKKAIDAIKLLKSHGYALTVTMSIHMGNLASLLQTYQLMKDLHVDMWKAVPIIDTGNWKNQKDKEMDLDTIYGEYLKLLRLYKEDGAPMQLGLGGFFQCKRHRLDTWYSPAVSGCGTADRCKDTLCEAVRIFPYLLPDGRVLPCIAMSGSEMESIAPNIFEEGQSMEKALSHSAIEAYIDHTYGDLFAHNAECSACPHRYVCNSCRANALSQGGFYAKDLSACRFVRGGYQKKIEEIMNG